MKNYYIGKEILLGLRQELVKLNQIFRELDKMLISYGDEKYKGAYFYNYVHNSNKLDYNLRNNYPLYEKIKQLLFHQINLFDCIPSHLETSIDQNGNYLLIDNDKNLVREDKQDEFNEKVESLFHNNFVKEINKIEYNNHSLAINSASLSYFDCDEKIGKNILSFHYYVKNDEVYLWITGKNRFRTLESIIDEVLSIKIPKGKLSPFLQQIIEENPETKKEIIVPNERLMKSKNYYYLNEERDNYILVKKRK